MSAEDKDDSPPTYSPFDSSRESLLFSIKIINRGDKLSSSLDLGDGTLSITKTFKERKITVFSRREIRNKEGKKKKFAVKGKTMEFNEVDFLKNVKENKIILFRFPPRYNGAPWIESLYLKPFKYINTKKMDTNDIQKMDFPSFYWVEIKFKKSTDFTIFTQYMKMLHFVLRSKEMKLRENKVISKDKIGKKKVEEWKNNEYEDWLKNRIYVKKRKKLETLEKTNNELCEALINTEKNKSQGFLGDIYNLINSIKENENITNLLDQDIMSSVSINRELIALSTIKENEKKKYLSSQIHKNHAWKNIFKLNKNLEIDRIKLIEKRRKNELKTMNVNFFDPLKLHAPEEDRKYWDIDSCVDDILCILLFKKNLNKHLNDLNNDFKYNYGGINGEEMETFKNDNFDIKWENIDFSAHLKSMGILIEPDRNYESAFSYSSLRKEAIRKYLKNAMKKKTAADPEKNEEEKKFLELGIKIAYSISNEGIKENEFSYNLVNKFISNFPFGLCHAYIMLGNVALHWVSDSEIMIRDLDYQGLGSGYEEIFACDVNPPIIFTPDTIIPFLEDLAAEIIRINLTYNYELWHLIGTKKKNCQEMTNVLLDFLLNWRKGKMKQDNLMIKKEDVLYPVICDYMNAYRSCFKNNINDGRFILLDLEIYKELKKNISKKKFKDKHYHTDLREFKKEDHAVKLKEKETVFVFFSRKKLREYKKVFFQTHEELDIMYLLIVNGIGKFKATYPGLFMLFKSFDRGFWNKYLRLEEKRKKNSLDISCKEIKDAYIVCKPFFNEKNECCCHHTERNSKD